MIYIIGHQKPDLDSAVAPIALAGLLGDGHSPALTEPVNTETLFVFNKYNQTPPPVITAQNLTEEDRVILVDHNETDQRLPGIAPEKITAIYDHHKVNLNLSHPINIHVRAYGSVNTVIWELYQQLGKQIDPPVATLMLCAVLSDTVGLKSSTVTDIDHQAAKSLAQIAGITYIDALTLEIFKAKSDLSALTDEQIVLNDYKVFDFSGKKVLIGQIETVEQDDLIASRKDKLLLAMGAIKSKEGVDYLFLALTDILKINTRLLLLSESEEALAVKAFGGTPDNFILDIGPKMSRKKDIAPSIENALK